MKSSELIKNILTIANPRDFEALAMRIFRFQAQNNTVYQNYLEALKIAWQDVQTSAKIPFLPIEFFKSHEVMTGKFAPQMAFASSGTTSTRTSKHYVKDINVYEQTFMAGFKSRYGNPSDYVIFGLLPSYLERNNSSLVHMVSKLIELSNHPQSGFFLHNQLELSQQLRISEDRGQQCLLIGVTFALLDFAEKFEMPLKNTIIMETGGMKGKREEITREEVTEILQKAFHLKSIHSEYGMTELFSQAYSSHSGLFECPPWMKVYVRDPSDPFKVDTSGNGALNIIDLANIDSCSFIATQDLGRVNTNGSFEVIGRYDLAEPRGCNLMMLPNG